MARAHKRVAMDLFINKLVDGIPFMARTRNISEGGVFVDRLLEPTTDGASHIALEFMLPGSDEVIWAEAEVAFDVPQRGVGLRFTRLDPFQAALIADYVHAAA